MQLHTRFCHRIFFENTEKKMLSWISLLAFLMLILSSSVGLWAGIRLLASGCLINMYNKIMCHPNESWCANIILGDDLVAAEFKE